MSMTDCSTATGSGSGTAGDTSMMVSITVLPRFCNASGWVVPSGTAGLFWWRSPAAVEAQ